MTASTSAVGAPATIPPQRAAVRAVRWSALTRDRPRAVRAMPAMQTLLSPITTDWDQADGKVSRVRAVPTSPPWPEHPSTSSGLATARTTHTTMSPYRRIRSSRPIRNVLSTPSRACWPPWTRAP